jgi:hypothetical protein
MGPHAMEAGAVPVRAMRAMGDGCGTAGPLAFDDDIPA